MKIRSPIKSSSPQPTPYQGEGLKAGLKLSKYDPLPNLDAISHLDKKTLLESYHYLDILAHEHAVGFTVAKMMDKDLLAETKQALLEAMENGTDFRTFQRRLKPYLMAKGWWGEQVVGDPKDGKINKVQLGSTRRLKTIYTTNLRTANASARWQRIQGSKKRFPYLQYLGSTSENKRIEHQRYYGLVLPVDHPLWQYIFPPNDYGCKCRVRQLTEAEAKAIGISEDFEIEWEEIENIRTGEKVTVPKGVGVSFNHNHGDRLGALFKIAEDKHGGEFVRQLKEQYAKADNYDLVISQWMKDDEKANYLDLRESKYKSIVDRYGLETNEYLAIKHYTEDGYRQLNKLFNRLLDDVDNEDAFTLMLIRELLNQSLMKMPRKEGRFVRRLDLTGEQLKNYVVGKTVTFYGFTSTTYGKDVIIKGAKNTRFVIYGKSGYLVDELSKYNQSEVLFGSPTKFKVRAVVKKPEYTEITLEEV